MPLVTLTGQAKDPQFKSGVLDALHAALVSSGVPAADKFQRVLQVDGDDFASTRDIRTSPPRATTISR
jgi:hypothetical protein